LSNKQLTNREWKQETYENEKGKDTTTGHWEMMGIITTDPFPTFKSGFPQELIEQFEKQIGRKT